MRPGSAAARIGSGGLAIAYTRLADGDRTDTGHHLALRQVAMADDTLMAVRGLQIGMLAEKVCNLGFDRLGEKGTCPVAQDFCELVVEDSWLNQLDDVIVGHGISLLRWRSGGVKHPHDMPPSRFPPSPTLGDSSGDLLKAHSGFSPPDQVLSALSNVGGLPGNGGKSDLKFEPSNPGWISLVSDPDLLRVGDGSGTNINPSVTPLPASWTMMLMGLALIGIFAWFGPSSKPSKNAA